MLRTTLAAIAIAASLASASYAGDCMSCGSVASHGGGWDNYCGADSCCAPSCGSNRCCFPLLNNALHRLGCVVDCLIPDPCCRRSCGAAVSCAQPACGLEPGCEVHHGYGPMPSSDPFIDDHSGPPTPLPDKGARARSMMGTPKMTYRSTPTITSRPATQSKPALKPIPMKSAAARSASKPLANGKAIGKSVLKVAYEEEPAEVATASDDAPPTAPASIRNTSEKQSDARFAAKPVVRAPGSQLPANPLR